MDRRVRWSPKLCDAIEAGLQLTVVGAAPLPAPMSSVAVLARGGPGTVSLAAALVPGVQRGALAFLGLGRLANLDPREMVAGRFRTRRSGNTVVVLDDQGDDALALAPGLLTQPTLTAGTWPVLRPLVGTTHVPARPARPRERLEAELDRFCLVLEALVDAAGAPGDFELELAPTRLTAEAALAGAVGVGRKVAERVRGEPPARRHREEGDVAVGFDDVGGQGEAKAQLQAVVTALRDPDAYRRWGARPPRGVLLFGPPGTGKTLLARALARESQAVFLHVRVSDVTSKWYGEAEKRLQAAFDEARRSAPAVLFFDEIDALARSRDDAHEATHRLVSTFLENMDGLATAPGVVVLAATNRPEAVDPAITRPGRFDRLVEVPLPAADARRAILEVHLRQAAERAGRPVVEPIDEGGWERLLMATEGQSGADLAEVVRRALEAKVRAGAGGGHVTQEELLVEAAGVGRPWAAG